MKYILEQTVILLDTTFKPVGTAVIKGYDPETNKYRVAFVYPHQSDVELINVLSERLLPLD